MHSCTTELTAPHACHWIVSLEVSYRADATSRVVHLVDLGRKGPGTLATLLHAVLFSNRLLPQLVPRLCGSMYYPSAVFGQNTNTFVAEACSRMASWRNRLAAPAQRDSKQHKIVGVWRVRQQWRRKRQ